MSNWIKYYINWKKRIGRLYLSFQWRRKDSFMGRFGGGWNWELGFQIGEGTIIFNLLFCNLEITWKRKKTNENSISLTKETNNNRSNRV